MKLLITGGAGFIGSNLVRWMLRSGHEVLNVDKLTYAGNLNSLSDVADCDRYHFSQIDIADREAIRAEVLRFQPEAMMHLAAETHVDRSIQGPRAFIESNILGTFCLLEAALEHWRSLDAEAAGKFRFLHVSTDEVYGSLGRDGAFTETTRYDPHSPYSASKAASDHLVRAWHATYGLPVIVTNCSNNYGPFQYPEKLIPVVILKCLRGEPIPVYGNGDNVRDWLYVDDHCDALSLVMQRGHPGETYNIGGNGERSNMDVVRILCEHLDDLHPRASSVASGISKYFELVTFVADRPAHDLRYAIDATKIKREVGWTPKHDLTSGFRKTVEWYLSNTTWCEEVLARTRQLEQKANVNT